MVESITKQYIRQKYQEKVDISPGSIKLNCNILNIFFDYSRDVQKVMLDSKKIESLLELNIHVKPVQEIGNMRRSSPKNEKIGE